MAIDNLKEFLRHHREKNGLRQADVAKVLGYGSSQFVSNWERGRSYPPLSSLSILSELYQVPLEKIYKLVEKAVIEDLILTMKNEFKASK